MHRGYRPVTRAALRRIVMLVGALIATYYVLVSGALIGPIVLVYAMSAQSLNILADLFAAGHAHFSMIALKFQMPLNQVVFSFWLSLSTYIAFIAGGIHLARGRTWARWFLVALLLWLAACLSALEMGFLPAYSLYDLFGFYDWTTIIVHVLILFALFSSFFRNILEPERGTAIGS